MRQTLRKKAAPIIRRIGSACRTFENRDGKLPEVAGLSLYIVLASVIKAFHEPWFDEAQSWMIARSASIAEILTVIPHYEGHPPVWHLFLLPFARSGIPYEIGLNAASLLLCSAAMGLLIFKSPFPRIVRLCIPFTYFFFYQYGVISRNYSLMMLGFVLCALFYKERNEKPFPFVLAMILVCGSSAYGIVLCGGISLVWLYEIWDHRKFSDFVRSFRRDRRIFALLLLGAAALYFVISIVPYADTFAMGLKQENSLFLRLAYLVFIAPADSVLTNCYLYYDLLMWQTSWGLPFLLGLIIGIYCCVLLVCFAAGHKKAAILIVPHVAYALFGAFMYFKTHHIGILALFLMFWFWIVLDDKTVAFRFPPLFRKLFKRDFNLKVLRNTSVVIVAMCFLVSLYWTACASYHEITRPYGYAREMSAYLKSNGLDDKRMMASWNSTLASKEDSRLTPDDTNVVRGVDLLPYFSDNIISNLNGGSSSYPYLRHITATDADNRLHYALWAKGGLPEVFIGDINLLTTVFGSRYSPDDYVLVHQFEASYLWKNTVQWLKIPLYVREDTAGELGLPEMPVKDAG